MIAPIQDFRRSLEEAVSERRVPSAYGAGLFVDSLPQVYDLNYLRAEQRAPAAELAREADRLMEAFLHRKVVVEDGGGELDDDFRELGWQATTHLVMAHVREPDRRVAADDVREVAFERLASLRASIAETEYGEVELAEQLNEAQRRIGRAVPTRWLAAFAGDAIAAYCQVRSRDGVAQIEDVNTLPGFRGRGLGRAIVQRALDDAQRDHEIVFLEALEDDWPRQLYARLGFRAVDTRRLLLLPPSPLSALRLRTPRLELRLGSVAELRALARLARGGIHDPAVMPFEVPWTDRIGEAGFEDAFVEYHRSKLRTSQPESWRLELLAFHGGRVVGTQGIGADGFAGTREVSTGSWLGARWQRLGLGTEMRAAVLTLAFDGLGARTAVSAAWEHNHASLGVSRRLGYLDEGNRVSEPRGEPVVHRVLRLDRKSFRSPVAVEIAGLDPVLPLLGAAT